MSRAPDERTLFGDLLTRHQNRLFAFIAALVTDRELAADILQETNLVLWRKSDEYDRERDFLPWAIAVARHQIRAALQTQKRSRIVFSPDVLESLADRLSRQLVAIDERQVLLETCLKTLTESQRELIRKRYELQHSLREIAEQLHETANTVGVTIHRIRQSLSDCIRSRTQERGS